MRNGQASENGHVPGATAAELNRDLLESKRGTGNAFRGAVLLFGALFILGVVGFIMRVSDGVSDKAVWGYHAALFSFLLTTAMAAPIVAIAPRIAKGQWRRSISRSAELWTLVGLLNLILFIPLLWVLPSLKDERRSLWFFDALVPDKVPQYSPHVWATLALVALIVCGLMLLWISALPDLAAIRDRATGRRQRFYARLAFGWHGTSRQWKVLFHRQGIIGAFYFMMLVFVHFLIGVDFLMALVPGWIDALFPATQAANALQAGGATVLLTMFFLRKFGGSEKYITLDQFWGLGKLVFALSLLWFWFWFSSFIVLWYGKKPNEQAVLELFIKGPYIWAFFAAFILNFIFPFLTMIWNAVRKSIWGPTIMATSILIGTLLDRIRLYVPAYSVSDRADQHELGMDQIPATIWPELADVFLILGVLAGAVLIFMLATKVFPPVNVWEQKELLMYQWHKRFHRTEVRVLAKPE